MTVLALFGDGNVVPALHVAIASALANWRGPEPLHVHVFHRDLSDADLALLAETAKTSVFHEAWFDTTRIRHWRSLYGSHMPYGRLFLPDLLPDEESVIYLDADAIVEIDVRDVVPAQIDLLAAMPAWDFAHSHDAEIAAESDIALTDTYYHSGLLVMPLARWREEKTVARCLEVGDRFAARLHSHDQTILNIVCHGRITPIAPELTTHLYPTATPNARRGEKAIRNFCGAPKPFDLLGNVLNVHYDLFDQWLARTAIAGWSPNRVGRLLQVKRNLRLLKPIAATTVKRLLGAFRRG
jgi:lipopolysaccharide biosynthesis glycosyltransferase